MAENLYQNWPVYLLLGGFITFVVFVLINSKRQERINKEAQDKEKDDKGKI